MYEKIDRQRAPGTGWRAIPSNNQSEIINWNTTQQDPNLTSARNK